MKRINQLLVSIIALSFAGCANNAANEDTKDSTATAADSAAATTQVAVNPLKDCYFGDLHLHTSFSADANFFGATLLPEDAYKYAMGEVEWISSN